ncbi:MAG TPA: DPP IV N-terminal domain-containing protein, partial [Pyrinomonadaceae bacterium]|nr:DPP IV N-terminal domain-containing protein [Pyrinomonadaceae bacterium]
MKTKRLRYASFVLCVLSLLAPQFLFAQTPSAPSPKPFELTVDSIMRGPRLVGYPPTGVYWSQDSQRVYFRWKQADEARLKETSLYVVNRDGTGLRRLSDDEAKQAPPANGELSRDKTMTVFTEEGDVFIYDHVKNQRRQITRTVDAELGAHFTFDQKHVYFTRQGNLYVMALDGGSLEQLTDIRVGGAGPAPTAASGAGGAQRQGASETQQRGTDSQEYLKKEERALLDAVREKAEQREEQEKKRKEREKRKPFNVPAGQNVVNLNLSPDTKYVIATISEPGTGSKNTILPNFVTESGYTEDISGRTKVGDTQNRTRLTIIDVETGESKNVDHDLRQTTDIPPVRSGVVSMVAEQGQPKPPLMPKREVQFSQLQWSEDGKNAVLSARSADNKDRWVMLLDAATGKTKVLTTVHDDAWIDGPGASTLGWLPDNAHVYFESEHDGFAHLYSVAITGGEPTQLTSGQFEVSDV